MTEETSFSPNMRWFRCHDSDDVSPLEMGQPWIYRGLASSNLGNADSQDSSIYMPVTTHSSGFNLLNLFQGAEQTSNYNVIVEWHIEGFNDIDQLCQKEYCVIR